MITITPKEVKQEALPQPVEYLILTNETLASIDADIEIEDKSLKIIIRGIYLGKPQDTPFEGTKKKWTLG